MGSLAGKIGVPDDFPDEYKEFEECNDLSLEEARAYSTNMIRELQELNDTPFGEDAISQEEVGEVIRRLCSRNL